MVDPILGGLAISAGTAVMNNLLNQKNASDSYEREKKLMDKQHSMNVADTVNAHTYNVEGMRMAGLNPALGQGATPAVPATGLGSADMAQTSPMDPKDVLTMAQIDNIQADTEVKKAQVPDLKASAGLKVAETLFRHAGTAKINEETRNIENINRQYADQNQALGAYGQIMAQKWQSSEWYAGLSPDSKYTIDAMATGELPMSVGAMTALERTIQAQKNLSDADRAVVKNAFDNAVADAMFNDQAVMNAIAREPRDKQKMLYKHMDEIETAIKKMNAEIPNIIQELQNLQSKKKSIDMDTAFNEAKMKAFKAGDLDYLKSQGEYGKWTEKYAEDRLADIIKVVPAIAGGRAIGSTIKVPAPESKPVIFKPTPNDYDKVFPRGFENNKPWWK